MPEHVEERLLVFGLSPLIVALTYFCITGVHTGCCIFGLCSTGWHKTGRTT